MSGFLFHLLPLGRAGGAYVAVDRDRNVKHQMPGVAAMEVLAIAVVGTIVVAGLYQIVRDRIRESRKLDEVAQETLPAVEAETKSSATPDQASDDEATDQV
jgi:type II secretory pathway component PulK